MKNKLRDEFFDQHVCYKTTDGIPIVSTHPHKLFEWFKEKIIRIETLTMKKTSGATSKNSKQHICELCQHRMEFPKCLPNGVAFGDGKGGDNIIECRSFEALGMIAGVVDRFVNEVELVEHTKALDKDERIAMEMIDVMLRAGLSYDSMLRVIQKVRERCAEMDELEVL